MTRLYRSIADFRRDTRGATAIEYGLIASIVSIAIMVGILAVRDGLITLPMQEIADALPDAAD